MICNHSQRQHIPQKFYILKQKYKYIENTGFKPKAWKFYNPIKKP